MRLVQSPYVLVWSYISLTNAISFGRRAALIAEILMGRIGMRMTIIVSPVPTFNLAQHGLCWPAERIVGGAVGGGYDG